MSHFTVAIFTEEGGKTIEQLLAPYQENNMGDCPKEYLEFNDVTEEYTKEYESDGVEMVKTPNGDLVYPWDDRFRKQGEIGHGSDTHEVPEGQGYELVTVKHKDRYPDLDAFIADWAGYEKDPETGRHGYWENPNKKWDWWTVGGRWRSSLLTKGGARTDSAKVKDIDWEGMARASAENAKRHWDEAQGQDEGQKRFIYGVREGDTEEAYIQRRAEFSTFAVIKPDGTWHEKGKMGWWACVSDEKENWNDNYFEAFIKNADPELTLTIVDCHI